MIDACAEAKVDVVKFQAHVAEAESTLDEPFRVKFSHKKTKIDLNIGKEWNFLYQNGDHFSIMLKKRIIFYGFSFF